MTTQTRRLTYEEYIEGPEINQRYDIVDGEMIMAPSPTYAHQLISRQTFRLLDSYVVEHQIGEVLYAPMDVVIQNHPLRTRQPDLLFIGKDRVDIVESVIEGAPNLVVEILSPGNSRSDLQEKLADYATIGIEECWLISPEAQTVEVLNLSEGMLERSSLHGMGDSVQTQVLEGLELEVSQIFV